MADILKVAKRSELGRGPMKRLRAAGKVPAVLYGHGQENVNLAVELKDLQAVLKHSGHFVSLAGDVEESALIKDVQWDHVTDQVLHVDLNRVDATESVEVTLNIELRGTAKGAALGGIVNQLLHEVDVICPANALPDRLELKINDLEVDHALRLQDIALPPGAKFVGSAETIVVQCSIPHAKETEQVAEAGPAEPEVIGRAKAEDEEGEA